MDKKVKVAINGFGRIGRLFFKLALKNENLEIVAINDLGSIENMAYLLKYDSAQKDLNLPVEVEEVLEDEKYLIVDGKKYRFYSIRNPEELPWGELGVDVVAEATGVFASFEKSQAHLKAGAKKVVISGPVKDSQNFELPEGKCNTALIGINDEIIANSVITSNGSCTTNAVGIPMQILLDEVGIETALLNTVHSYTATQSIVDGPVRPGKKDFRRGRAAAQNLVPTSTGSAVAVAKVLPELEGKFDGIAMRVPTVVGSMVDITMILKEEKTAEEVNGIFRNAASKYAGKMRVEEEQIVSSDIIGDTHTSIVDLSFTRVEGRLLKIMVWYDNEAGYSQSLVNHVEKIGKSIS